MNLWSHFFSREVHLLHLFNLFRPKYEPKIVRISAMYYGTLQGRNPYNIWFIFWEKQWLHKFILKFTDIYFNSSAIKRSFTHTDVTQKYNLFSIIERGKINSMVFQFGMYLKSNFWCNLKTFQNKQGILCFTDLL